MFSRSSPLLQQVFSEMKQKFPFRICVFGYRPVLSQAKTRALTLRMLQSLKEPLELMWLPARVSIENWKIAHTPGRPLSCLAFCSSSSTPIQSVKMAQQESHDLPRSAAVVKWGCCKVWLSWSAVPEKCCCRKGGDESSSLTSPFI